MCQSYHGVRWNINVWQRNSPVYKVSDLKYKTCMLNKHSVYFLIQFYHNRSVFKVAWQLKSTCKPAQCLYSSYDIARDKTVLCKSNAVESIQFATCWKIRRPVERIRRILISQWCKRKHMLLSEERKQTSLNTTNVLHTGCRGWGCQTSILCWPNFAAQYFSCLLLLCSGFNCVTKTLNTNATDELFFNSIKWIHEQL